MIRTYVKNRDQVLQVYIPKAEKAKNGNAPQTRRSTSSFAYMQKSLNWPWISDCPLYQKVDNHFKKTDGCNIPQRAW